MSIFHQFRCVWVSVGEVYWVFALNTPSALQDILLVHLQVQSQPVFFYVTVFLRSFYPEEALLLDLFCSQRPFHTLIWVAGVDFVTHAQTLKALLSPNFAMMLSKLSKSSRMILASASLSLEAFVTTSGGQFSCSDSHLGPSHHVLLSLTSPQDSNRILLRRHVAPLESWMELDLANSILDKLFVCLKLNCI